MTINKNQLKIITELRKNSRVKMTEISKRHKIAASTLYDALRGLSEKRLIEFTSLIDFKKIGFQHEAMLILRTDYDTKQKLRLYLTDCKNVNSLYMIDAGYDYLIQTTFKNQKKFQEFLEDIQSKNLTNHIMVFNLLDVIHREHFMRNEDHFH